MAKREPVRIPLDFEQVVSDLLSVKPPPKGEKAKKSVPKARKAAGKARKPSR